VVTSVAAFLNNLPEQEAHAALHKCCACDAWVMAMLEKRPYPSDAALYDTAERAWVELNGDDWLEAFAGHPRIGGTIQKNSATAGWSAAEQAGATRVDADTTEALRAGNLEYENRFGHVFLICATGKSAAEMLAALQNRLHNDAATELHIAAGEQAKITRLRLARLVEP
jgi:2-oxo-4-hydroxy-4-carboxy-5-ureidoimidazoline decarboxylase